MIGILLVVAGLVALGWTLLARRLIRWSQGESYRFLRPFEGRLPELPAVDAIIPARNEQDHLASTIDGLRAQEYPGLTITIVNDQSTDQTGEILDQLANDRDHLTPMRVIHGIERPEGWVGKTWAVHQGVAQTPADWLWFVDADMGLHPRALASAIVEADRSGADFLSILPGVRCRSFWQGTIAGSFLQLLAQLYPLDLVNDPDRPEAIAAGGFILVRRSAYDRSGGHEACRDEIIDDIRLAGRVKASGGRLTVRLGPDLAWTHMYGQFGDIWRGLRKNAYAGMDYQPHKYVTGATLALIFAWAPWFALVVGMFSTSSLLMVVGFWGLMAQAVASIPILIFLRLNKLYALSMPIGITAYVAIATSSVWHHHRGRILWKDRALPSMSVSKPRPLD